jgi:hypothetical protein
MRFCSFLCFLTFVHKSGIPHEDHFDLLLPTGMVLHLTDDGIDVRGAVGGNASGGVFNELAPAEHVCQPGDLTCIASHEDIVGMPMYTEWDEFFL